MCIDAIGKTPYEGKQNKGNCVDTLTDKSKKRTYLVRAFRGLGEEEEWPRDDGKIFTRTPSKAEEERPWRKPVAAECWRSSWLRDGRAVAGV